MFKYKVKKDEKETKAKIERNKTQNNVLKQPEIVDK